MATVPEGSARNRSASLGFGAAAVTFGFMGLAFSFLTPLGLCLSAAGLICGIIGWLLAWPGRSSGLWWSIWGTLLAVAAVGLNVALLNYGAFENWLMGG